MSVPQLNDNFNWLLVEWISGGRSVVYIRSVMSPLDTELKAGDLITVKWRGEPGTATLIARAQERDELDEIVKELGKKEAEEMEQEAGPSIKREEEAEDFSSSASSWVPSDDDAQSGDSDEVENKKIKLERGKRQSKKITSSNRAPVIPKTNSKTLDHKKPHSDSPEQSNNITINKSLPNSTKRNIHQNGEENQNAEKDPREIRNINNTFKLLLKMIKDLRQPGTSVYCPKMREHVVKLQKANEVLRVGNNQSIEEDSTKDEEDNREDDEFNRSNDNVLITNKYSKVAGKTNNKDADKEEWVPNGGEKTCKQKHKLKLNRSVEECARKDEEKNQVNEKCNRSDDNVLKTNKRRNVVGTTNNKNEEWIPIGSGKTLVHKDRYKRVNWKSYTIATRTLLCAVFSRRILATHSLTGKKSPAFQNKPAKMCLDPKIVSDVILTIMDKFPVRENLVRSIITTKCADECKMWKTQVKKKNASHSQKSKNNENMPPPATEYNNMPPPATHTNKMPPPAIHNNNMPPPTHNSNMPLPLTMNYNVPISATKNKNIQPPPTQTNNMPPPATFNNNMPPPLTQADNKPPPATHNNNMPPPAIFNNNMPPPAPNYNNMPPQATYIKNTPPPVTYNNDMPPPAIKNDSMPPPTTYKRLKSPTAKNNVTKR